MRSDQQQIGFIERYALQYYLPCLQYALLWTIYLQTNEPAYILMVVFAIQYIGRFLPKDSFPVLNSTEHNKNIFQVFPLVALIICTWVTIGKLFIDNPFADYSIKQCILSGVVLIYTLPAAIDASHELIHRPQQYFKIIGFVNMALFQFTVYPIEHVQLHHKMVVTDKDPITSPKNRSLYWFIPNSFYQAHKYVFLRDKKMFAVCMATNWLYLGVMLWHAMREFNDWGLALWKVTTFAGIGLFGWAFLENIEYIEHYGLIYRKDADEKKILEVSSWNSDENILANWLVFRFQRHSDHHMNAYKVFTTL